jgi:hypothetical protein
MNILAIPAVAGHSLAIRVAAFAVFVLLLWLVLWRRRR